LKQCRHGRTVKRIDDLGPKFETELEEFFVNYPRLGGKKYRILAMKGPSRARRCMKEGRRAAQRNAKFK
jgi:inorganic pyrophosphatase